MKPLTVVFAVALGLMATAHNVQAKIGEGLGWTLAETVQQYGKPITGPTALGIGKTEYNFETQEYSIRAIYLNGLIGAIAYGQANSFDAKFLKEFFLSDNAPEAMWSAPVKDNSGAVGWVGKTGDQMSYLACVNASGNFFMIATAEYLQSSNMSELSKDTKDRDGKYKGDLPVSCRHSSTILIDHSRLLIC